eukprot:3286005-Pleurochrysis_carterae.AAC.1
MERHLCFATSADLVSCRWLAFASEDTCSALGAGSLEFSRVFRMRSSLLYDMKGALVYPCALRMCQLEKLVAHVKF